MSINTSNEPTEHKKKNNTRENCENEMKHKDEKKKRTSKPLNQSEKLTANGQNSAAHIAQVVNMNDALPF